VILGIDTSLGTAVALVDVDGYVVAEASSDNPLGHAEVIGTLLTQVIGDGAVVTAVAAGMGPGPFTGLRVGIASARAFAVGRDVPVIAVPSHDAAALELLIAAAGVDSDLGRFAVVTDARRREFAYTIYEGLDDDGLPVRVAEPALAPRDTIDDVLSAQQATRHDVTRLHGSLVAIAGARALAAGRTLAGPEPLYLRAPDVSVPNGVKRVTA